MDLFALKLALLGFWALWFAIVALTNVFGALRARGVLPESWRFAARNYEAVVKATSVYRAPPWLPRALFTGVVVWQAFGAALYCWAFVASLDARAPVWPAVNLAFATGIGLWAAFMIADELTFKYAYEQSHELLFIAQLASLGAMYLGIHA